MTQHPEYEDAVCRTWKLQAEQQKPPPSNQGQRGLDVTSGGAAGRYGSCGSAPPTIRLEGRRIS